MNRIDVRFKDNVQQAQIDSLIQAVRARVLRRPMPDSGYLAYRLEYPLGVDALAFSRDLYRHPLVEWAGPDGVSNRRLHYVPTDPLFGTQFHLANSIHRNGVPVDINATAAWDLSLGGSIKVAVIDDGIDAQHCPPGRDLYLTPCSGMISWDAFNVPGENATAPCCNDVHGTAVTGIIAGAHNNGLGGVGIAPGVTLRAIRIFRRTYPPENSFRNQTSQTIPRSPTLSTGFGTTHRAM